ncbi:alkylphosphonate utilization protein [Thiomicrorhabdus sp. 6S3-12]|uniref:PhnA domain-containing protein n=1 Tax=Thiomicrorhabdus sp. 6S3-12 TaxID=2819681 RepID=UPI001AACC19A|nr:alkylphosphonate utilization protein [Thiomicrorhabdus sp. 6S3-12]MBO1924031.1 PhnA domain-containing protein [Thiomicrorhabdus sp. 6S3-12]
MSIEQQLMQRSEGKCELCGATENLSVMAVEPSDGSADESILVCGTCRSQVENPDSVDTNHWRCLNDAIWNPNPAVQVVAYRMLNQLASEGWPQELMDMMYMEDATREWALKGIVAAEDQIKIVDSNGNQLNEGDDVTLIKDLDVKGAGFTAKRGTLVKNIHLTDNPKHIEGKINGSQIVIVAAFTKKA